MIKIDDSGHVDIKKNHLKYFEDHCLSLLKKYAAQKYNLAHEKKVLEYLKDSYAQVLIGSPEELRYVIKEIKQLTGGHKFSQKTYQKMKLVFNYDSFSKRSPGEKGTNWGGYLLTEKLGVGLCPYCNRQYVTSLRISQPRKKGTPKSLREGQTRATLDHFYDKGRYPYLAISLYNLIPSCKVCNSDFKGSQEMCSQKYLHPYEDGFGSNARFTVIPKASPGRAGQPYDVTSLLGGNDRFQIGIRYISTDLEFNQRAERNADLFKLVDLYNFHKEEVRELLQKTQHYSEDYIDIILSQSGSLFNSREEVARFVVGNYPREENYGRRSLAKFTADIAEELGLLKHLNK